MVADIVLPQQVPEIFNSARAHHRTSTSAASTTFRRSPSTTQSASSSHTMTNGHRVMPNELGMKAEQILGHAPAVVHYSTQHSMDLSIQQAPRINITTSKARANNQQISPMTSSSQPITSKSKPLDVIAQLVPRIFQVVAPLTLSKLPATISRQSKPLDNVNESRQTHLASHPENDINLSEDENEEVDDKLAHENPTQPPHSDSDDEEASNHSISQNVDLANGTNPHTFSLSDFISGAHSPTHVRKRSRSPPAPPAEPIKPLKRKEELIRAFSSSVNIPIDVKQPTLPIAIPTHLFFEPNARGHLAAADCLPADKPSKRSKRDANGAIKHDANADNLDSAAATNSAQQKKSKTSHVFKSEPAVPSTSTNIKSEPLESLHVQSPHERLSAGNTATVAPTIVQPKKEKPTANVKPLLQTASVDNSSSTASNANVTNPPDRLLTTASATAKANHANLRNMSTKELNSLARKKKKQADGEKRTFDDAKQSMWLYLESVCYFIQCANDEPILEQRTTLLTATLAMLQHLAYNYQKMFHISTNQSAELVNQIRPKFLLINYWLQSYIYHLQYQANFPTIERSANQVLEQCAHSKSPEDGSAHVFYDFSKYMLPAYQSTYYWNKAERLTREEPSKKFLEQLLRQNQNQRLSRDDSTLNFLLYIFDAIDLLRLITT